MRVDDWKVAKLIINGLPSICMRKYAPRSFCRDNAERPNASLPATPAVKAEVITRMKHRLSPMKWSPTQKVRSTLILHQ